MRINDAFRHLSTKLTVLFAGLFGFALLAVALTVYVAISENAARTVRQELQANGAVFDRVWAMREKQLKDSAGILARDFGFRDAVASKDQRTINSALDNLRERLKIDHAFMMDADGNLIGLDNATTGETEFLWDALNTDEEASGVLTIGGRQFHAASAEILAPNLIGWVVFATELDTAQLQSLEKLAAIPLQAELFTRAVNQPWRTSDKSIGQSEMVAVTRIIDNAATSGNLPQNVGVGTGAAIALTKPLNTFGGQGAAVLLLRYRLALAMTGFHPLLASIVLIGLISVALIVVASWVLARGISRPIAALDLAAQALERGERTTVLVETSDEIGRLARSFNMMSEEIASREEHITEMALHDSDTGLPNRRALEASIARNANGFVLSLTIIRYQQIRDAIGFALAVQFVQALGEKLRSVHSGLVFGRLSADSLAAVLPTQDETEAIAFAAQLREALSGPIAVNGVQVDVALASGVAPIQQISGKAVLDQALIAAEQARSTQRDVAMFDPVAYGDPAQNLSLMSEMFEGINCGHLSLHYQPKLDLRKQTITSIEALARWNHPVRGRISPDVFVTAAEDTGYIRKLTEWTLVQAICDQKRLRASGLDMIVSVNLSGRLVGDPTFTDQVISLIKDANATLCLEITETAAMTDPEAAIRSIGRYSDSGIQISIDDYGAGFSSLSYLKRIAAHELKLDKSLIQSLSENSRDALLVKSTVDLAHSLGMKITAEGVETPPVLALLTSMGCDVAQGYFIGRPMPIADLILTLTTAESRPIPSATAQFGRE